MSKYVLKTKKLSKNYHSVNALKNVSLSLEAGKIYALIGKNGAGKTTLMRLITGLIFPTSGRVEIFGNSEEKALQNERKRIGSIIETPGFIPDMTAKENLKYYRIMRGIPDADIENDLLELVGLSDTDKKKVGDFSLGMKQRLGIAIALIASPEILILDEPINGLDPIGVIEIRNLLKKLCEEKQITILISSHNLPELYQTASDYIFIDNGEIKEILPIKQLEEACKRHLLISTEEVEKLTTILEMELNTSNYKVMPDKSVRLYDYLEERERVARVLYDNDIIATNISLEGDTLEEYFISIVGGASNV
ncbi:MAG: ABC transporter ATP-binding protein [bacterium]